MQKLKAGDYTYVTEHVVKSLTQNRIFTILDILQEDPEKLANITNLNVAQILDVRNEILQKYSAPIVSGISLNKNKYVPTGIPNLDSLLGGGVPAGFITEICGLAESGKTQLCLQLSINCAQHPECTVLYVDAKGDFSSTRVQKILLNCGYSYKDMAQLMLRIHILHVWKMDEIVELFKKLKNKIISFNKLSLIIIDSLPSLMFQFLGDDNKVGLILLNKLVNYSRYLCKEMNVAVVCVNIQTRWIEQDIVDDEDLAEQSTSHKGYTEKRNRCLGKYWENIPAVILILEKIQDNNSDTLINVSILKSFKFKENESCTLKISKAGVS